MSSAISAGPCYADASRPESNRQRIPIRMWAALALWLAIVVGGSFEMIRYSEVAGGGGSVPAAWPTSSKMVRDGGRPMLIMFVHPRCPCSRASVGELERLLARVDGKANAWVAFVKPAGSEAEWEKADLWRRVQSIHGVRVYTDEGGREARLFHAETSGQTLLYSAGGKLEFQGGITVARGHSGDNLGRSAVEEIVLHARSKDLRTPVFGCALFETKCQANESLCKP